jgi:hypothetical protein
MLAIGSAKPNIDTRGGILMELATNVTESRRGEKADLRL